MKIPKPITDQFMKFWYWYIDRRDKNSELTFLNYGFSNHKELYLNEQDEFNRYPIQLYDHITGNLQLVGLDVLEVGSGRGGGAEYITRSLKPNSYIGMDINKNYVKFCNNFYSLNGLSFKRGDALDLPFETNSFDVVLNVESSHRYTNVQKFLHEAHRVLKPRGHFLFTDFRERKMCGRLDQQLIKSNFKINKKEFITPCVVKALELDHNRRKMLTKKLSPAIFYPIAHDFSGKKGTRMYRRFSSGSFQYLYYIMQK